MRKPNWCLLWNRAKANCYKKLIFESEKMVSPPLQAGVTRETRESALILSSSDYSSFFLRNAPKQRVPFLQHGSLFFSMHTIAGGCDPGNEGIGPDFIKFRLQQFFFCETPPNDVCRFFSIWEFVFFRCRYPAVGFLIASFRRCLSGKKCFIQIKR